MIELVVTAIAGASVTAVGAWVLNRNRHRQLEASIRATQVRGIASVRAEQAAGIAAAEAASEARTRALDEELTERAEVLTEQEAHQDRFEHRQKARETSVQTRSDEIDQQYDALRDRRAELRALRDTANELDKAISTQLEEAAHITHKEAITELREALANEALVAAQKAGARLVEQTDIDQEHLAREMMGMVCQRYGGGPNTNRLISTVTLPKSRKLQARLLDNNLAVLQAITEATEVRFERLDEQQFLLKGPDPYTREIARLTYERMVRGGNITEPIARKAAAKTARDLEKMCRDAGKRATRILRIQKVHPEIQLLVGKLLYRTSYTQNQWQHAIEAAQLCGMMARSLGLNEKLARRAGLLHDIGKVLYTETEAAGSHAVSGAKFAKDHGERDEIVHAIAAHHNDEPPTTTLAHLVAAADALSGARPGARRETMESFSERVAELERISGSYREVEKSFVIQGGRELRIIVDPRRVDDLAALELSTVVAERIEDECVYPGQVKVVVLRETRSTATARFH